MKHHLIIATTIAILVTGCGTTSGTKIESSELTSIQKGQTTKSMLIQKYGQPTDTTVDSTGKETLLWYHTRSKTDPKTFIPFAGAFLGGATSETTTLRVMLDKRGVVQDYEYSGGKVASKLGAN